MKLNESLSREVESARRTGHAVPVIITMRSVEDVKVVLATGVKASLTYQHIPAVAAALTSDEIDQLAAMPQVELIELDTEASALRKP